MEKNHAKKLKAPKVDDRPTLPFSREEMLKIMAAIDAYGKSAGLPNAQRLKAFVLLLRYSGMRIGDCVKCSTERIEGDRPFLYTQKTGTPVRCVLPDFVIKELDAAPKSSEVHFFWTGKSKLHSAIGKWQRRLQRLFQLAGIARGARSPVPGYVFHLPFAGRYTSRPRQCVAWPSKCTNNGETLFGMGPGAAGTVRVRHEKSVERGSRYAPPRYTAGTRKGRAPQLIYFESIRLVGAVGIEIYPTPIKPCKQWCCSQLYRDNHDKHYKASG